MITGVMLNWRRPGNVARILAGWRAGRLVTEAIVWNNNPAAPLPRHDWASVIQSPRNMGLYPRFAVALLARHDCVLIQDDDLELPDETLEALHEAWQRDPEVIHGIFGREPKPDGSYARPLRGDKEAPIVLTRALIVRREYMADFFHLAYRPEIIEVQRRSRPPGNGEDILLSYAVRLATGRLNRLHGLPVRELPAPHAIESLPGHWPHRTRLLRTCEAWLEEASTSREGWNDK